MQTSIFLPPIGERTVHGVADVMHFVAHLNLFVSLVIAATRKAAR